MERAMMRTAAAVAALALLSTAPALTQGRPQDARDSNSVQDCIKTHGAEGGKWEACIGKLSNSCLASDQAKSTADQVECIAREERVWDDILNETYRRLRAKLDVEQQKKLREMQRAWIASRDRTCAFYLDYFQGTMAAPMVANCVNRETGRRALFLLGFLQDAEGN
jgi:uncharacterized protein YecT (DUF1311 family)